MTKLTWRDPKLLATQDVVQKCLHLVWTQVQQLVTGLFTCTNKIFTSEALSHEDNRGFIICTQLLGTVNMHIQNKCIIYPWTKLCLNSFFYLYSQNNNGYYKAIPKAAEHLCTQERRRVLVPEHLSVLASSEAITWMMRPTLRRSISRNSLGSVRMNMAKYTRISCSCHGNNHRHPRA